ncbi:hypothetical protein ACFXHA_40790 [Nocardia sp. NPDC059240]|uniref:hypothetical protein n=1 Tax=Nocardia sp. NPDC059240 TaxID=3346786 RepID=UPI003692D2C1
MDPESNHRSEPQPRVITEAHRRLSEHFTAVESPRWAEQAVSACLRRLMSSTITEAAVIAVEDAWVEDEWTFVVVYRSPYFDGVLGLRRSTYDPRDNTFSTMFDPELTAAPDPKRYGRDVADFDIGEPLGTVVGNLRVDDRSIHWWGHPPVPRTQ